VLSNAADRAKDNAGKIALSYRAARIYEQKLNQPDRAFRSYDRILTVDPSDTRAARALIPLYEKDEKWARLTPLYELLLEKGENEAEKLELLARLVDVSGRRLGDRKIAVAARRRVAGGGKLGSVRRSTRSAFGRRPRRGDRDAAPGCDQGRGRARRQEGQAR
jgi:hypothetical protein